MQPVRGSPTFPGGGGQGSGTRVFADMDDVPYCNLVDARAGMPGTENLQNRATKSAARDACMDGPRGPSQVRVPLIPPMSRFAGPANFAP